MATYTLTVDAVCPGGGHVTLGIWRDGVKLTQRIVDRDDIMDTPDFDAMLVGLIRLTLKKAGANNAAQRKAAIEAASWIV